MPIRRLCRRRRNGPGHGCARAVAGGITRRFRSEVLEEFQERVRGLVAFLPAAGRGGLLDRFLLLMHVGVKVGLRAGQGFMHRVGCPARSGFTCGELRPFPPSPPPTPPAAFPPPPPSTDSPPC